MQAPLDRFISPNTGAGRPVLYAAKPHVMGKVRFDEVVEDLARGMSISDMADRRGLNRSEARDFARALVEAGPEKAFDLVMEYKSDFRSALYTSGPAAVIDQARRTCALAVETADADLNGRLDQLSLQRGAAVQKIQAERRAQEAAAAAAAQEAERNRGIGGLARRIMANLGGGSQPTPAPAARDDFPTPGM